MQAFEYMKKNKSCERRMNGNTTEVGGRRYDETSNSAPQKRATEVALFLNGGSELSSGFPFVRESDHQWWSDQQTQRPACAFL